VHDIFEHVHFRTCVEEVLTVTVERDYSVEVGKVLQRNSFNFMSIPVYTVLCPDQSVCNIKYM